MKSGLRTFAVLIGVGLIAPGLQICGIPPALLAQAPADSENRAPAAPRTDGPAYKIDATLVNVDVLVTDEDGRVLPGLTRENFRVLDDGVPRQIVDFGPTTTPITIVMLMEYSAASYDYFAAKAADWGAGFLSHLEPRDWIALVTFDMNSTVKVDFTHSQPEVRDAIASLGFPRFREVNLHDALMDTLDKLDPVRGKKAILLLATGLNSFSAATLDDVGKRLKQTDATIFCIGLAESEYLRYGGSSMTYLQGKNAMTAFSRQTGGLAVFPRFEGELPEVFRSVVGFLRNEYSLSFRPPPESRDGRYHRLKVEIVGPDGKPLRVTNEKGKRRKIEVYARQGYVAPRDGAGEQKGGY
jgi:VWFA-related protein